MMRTGVRSIWILLLAGCATPAADRDPPAGPPVPRDVWLTEALAAAPLDRAALIERLGAPERMSARALPNRHDPTVTDSVVELVYPDARFVYYVVTAGPRDLLDFAEIASNAHLRRTPPGIGTPADSIRAWWGDPVAQHADELEYDCGTCEVPRPATFVIEDGRVQRIRFDLYVD